MWGIDPTTPQSVEKLRPKERVTIKKNMGRGELIPRPQQVAQTKSEAMKERKPICVQQGALSSKKNTYGSNGDRTWIPKTKDTTIEIKETGFFCPKYVLIHKSYVNKSSKIMLPTQIEIVIFTHLQDA